MQDASTRSTPTDPTWTTSAKELAARMTTY